MRGQRFAGCRKGCGAPVLLSNCLVGMRPMSRNQLHSVHREDDTSGLFLSQSLSSCEEKKEQLSRGGMPRF